MGTAACHWSVGAEVSAAAGVRTQHRLVRLRTEIKYICVCVREREVAELTGESVNLDQVSV